MRPSLSPTSYSPSPTHVLLRVSLEHLHRPVREQGVLVPTRSCRDSICFGQCSDRGITSTAWLTDSNRPVTAHPLGLGRLIPRARSTRRPRHCTRKQGCERTIVRTSVTFKSSDRGLPLSTHPSSPPSSASHKSTGHPPGKLRWRSAALEQDFGPAPRLSSTV